MQCVRSPINVPSATFINMWRLAQYCLKSHNYYTGFLLQIAQFLVIGKTTVSSTDSQCVFSIYCYVTRFHTKQRKCGGNIYCSQSYGQKEYYTDWATVYWMKNEYLACVFYFPQISIVFMLTTALYFWWNARVHPVYYNIWT